MLVLDLKVIGNTLYEIRNRKLMSRAEVAEKAEISDRTYADIERGSVNMRIETLLKICRVFNITPNDILVKGDRKTLSETDFLKMISVCSKSEQQTALSLLNVYLDSLNK